MKRVPEPAGSRLEKTKLFKDKKSSLPPPESAHSLVVQQLLRKQPKQTLQCIDCRLLITSPKERIEIAGKTTHTFTNPHGYSFTIGCFMTASGVNIEGTPENFWSWFADHAWQVTVCRQCGLHLGWLFSGPSRFYGLILNRLISVDLN